MPRTATSCELFEIGDVGTECMTVLGIAALQLPPGALELMGMHIAPDHDGGALGHPHPHAAQAIGIGTAIFLGLKINFQCLAF
jgi:hypothetical protein